MGLLCLGVVASPPLGAQEDDFTIVLRDGRTLVGRIEVIQQNSVQWRLPGLPQPQTYKFDQVSHIEFPEPPQWVEGMTLFDQGRFAEAAEIFKAFSLQRNNSTYYPAPGNFANLAERRLIDCYRRLRDPAGIALVSKKIEWAKIPPSERDVADVVGCWAAVGNGDWRGAQASLAKAQGEFPDSDPRSAELDYLAGLIAIGLEQPAEASIKFARAYAPDSSADAAMAADALKQAIEQILPDVERRGELRALVHLYAELHGNGRLWDGAGDFLEKLHAEGYKVEMSLAAAKEEAPAVVARFVRLERRARENTRISVSEVEVYAGEVNLATKGTASQSSSGGGKKREHSAMAAIDGNRSPVARVGSFTATEIEKSPWWELDLGAMEAIERVELYVNRNEQGKIVRPPGDWVLKLLNGSRKEVWSATIPQSEEEKTVIPIKREIASAASEEK